jgi:NADH:ubiquinone oxidoreductase subunit K
MLASSTTLLPFLLFFLLSLFSKRFLALLFFLGCYPLFSSKTLFPPGLALLSLQLLIESRALHVSVLSNAKGICEGLIFHLLPRTLRMNVRGFRRIAAPLLSGMRTFPREMTGFTAVETRPPGVPSIFGLLRSGQGV